MKRRSEVQALITGWRDRKRTSRKSLWIPVLFATCTMLIPAPGHAQIAKWSVSASAGFAQFNLTDVDTKNQADVLGFAFQGYPMGSIASLRQTPIYSAGVRYRPNREYSVSLNGSTWDKTVTASYSGPDASLRLDRGAGSTDIVLGIDFYPASRPYFLEWYVQGNLGLGFARATAVAAGSRMEKIAGVLTSVPWIDTDARYRKTKLTVGAAIGIDVPLFRGAALTAQGGYRFAPFGQLNGEARRFDIRSDETTSIDFDFSGIVATAGVRIEL